MMLSLACVSLSLFSYTALAIPTYPQSHHNNHEDHWQHDDHSYHSYPSSSSSPIVKIKNGTVEGIHSNEYNQDYFLGVPFAQPPVGSLRFRVPQSLNASWTSPLAAKEYSAACVGYGSDQWPYPSLSEDCLYLNIVRPSGYEKEDLPIAFWIHGGGLTQGSGIDQRYNMSNWVQRSVEIGKPVMGVSVNYRLSMWGFVTGEEVVESGNANLGFRDQRKALEWVRENIGAFGGDPSKVTIIGESAGGLSVGMQLTAYNGRDDKLFRGAVMQSGNPINYGNFDYNASDFLNASSLLGCGNATAKLDCLRTIPFSTLNTFINSTIGQLDWKPILDGDFIQRLTSIQLAEGAFVKVPIIDGANSDEGTSFGPPGVNSSTDFYNLLTRYPSPVALTPDQATKILSVYPSNTTDGLVPTGLPASYIPGPPFGASYRRSAAYYGDVVMIAPRRKTCQVWAAASVPAYCYRFNTVPAGVPATYGVTHFQEVAFVFNNQQGLGYGYPGVSDNPFEGVPESYFELAEIMSAAWMEFVSEGVPGGYWPVYESEGKGENWVFDANVTGRGYAEKDDWRKEGIDVINEWAVDVYHR